MWAVIDRYLTSIAIQIFGAAIAVLGTTEKVSRLGEDISGFICTIGAVLFFFGVILLVRSIKFMIYQIKLKVTKNKTLCREYGWTTGLICSFKSDYMTLTSMSKKLNIISLITRAIGILCILSFVAVFIKYIFVNDLYASKWPIYITTLLLMIGILLVFQSAIFDIENIKGSNIKVIKCPPNFEIEDLFEEIKGMNSECGKPHLETKESVVSSVIMFGPKMKNMDDMETLDYLYIHKNRKGDKIYIGKSTADEFTFEVTEEFPSGKEFTQEEIYQEVKKIVEVAY